MPKKLLPNPRPIDLALVHTHEEDAQKAVQKFIEYLNGEPFFRKYTLSQKPFSGPVLRKIKYSSGFLKHTPIEKWCLTTSVFIYIYGENVVHSGLIKLSYSSDGFIEVLFGKENRPGILSHKVKGKLENVDIGEILNGLIKILEG